MTTDALAIDLPAFQKLGIPVPLSQIEKQIQTLFADDSSSPSGEPSGVARASLINVVLYSEDTSVLEQNADKLAELASQSACRSILVAKDPEGASSEARAWIQVHCQVDRNGKKTVCSEHISFYLSGRVPGMLQNVVFAHLDSDLPLAFWWQGELSEAFEPTLYALIDRFLFDSETWQEPAKNFRLLLEARKQAASPFVPHDFAFTRLHWIRHAIADAFDRPRIAGALSSLDHVAIRFAPGHRISALYLATWIADRLEASLETGLDGEGTCRFASRKKTLPGAYTVSLTPMAPDRRGTVEVDFVMDNVGVEISRCQTRDFLRTRILFDGEEADEDWLPAKTMNDVSLVTGILTRGSENRSHDRMIPMLIRMLGGC